MHPEINSIASIPSRPEPGRVLMCTPEYFEIVDVKNVHMENQQGSVNIDRAIEQWNHLYIAYEKWMKEGWIKEIATLEGQPGMEDMVFCANQTFPWITETGEKVVVISKMRHASRQREVGFFENFFSDRGYRAIHLQNTMMFEGMGDCIPHPGRRLLYGGYGHRTHPDAFLEIGTLLNVPVVTLELIDERFYHLDTCFVPLDEETVMLCRDAFRKESMDEIGKYFKTVIEIPALEAEKTFALNAHVISSPAKAAILQSGAEQTIRVLKERGYAVEEVETGEFMKSGGSVFCMKMMFY